MDGYLEWNNVATGVERSDSTKVDFLWLKSGGKYRIRPIHLAVSFFKYFHRDGNGKLRTAICSDPDTCSVLASHPDLKKPGQRYAIFVIDRADNKIKVMEGPKTVFVPFRKRFEVTQTSPGGAKDGGDWLIEVAGSGKKTTYSSTYIEDTPLTKDEREMLKDFLEEDKEKLKKIYKADSVEDIERKLFGEWEESPVTETPIDSKDSDDDFNF